MIIIMWTSVLIVSKPIKKTNIAQHRPYHRLINLYIHNACVLGLEIGEEVLAFKLVLSMGLPDASRQWILQRLQTNAGNVSPKIFQGPQTPSSVLQGLEASLKNKSSLLLEVKSALRELFAKDISDVDLTREGDQHELSELSELNVSTHLSQNGQKSTQQRVKTVDKKLKVKPINRQWYQPAPKRMPPGPPSMSQLDRNKRLKVSQEEADQSNKVSALKRNLKGMNIELKIQPPAPKPTGVSFSNISEIKNFLKQEAVPSKPISNTTFPKREEFVVKAAPLGRVVGGGHQVALPVVTRIHNCLLCRFGSTPHHTHHWQIVLKILCKFSKKILVFLLLQNSQFPLFAVGPMERMWKGQSLLRTTGQILLQSIFLF